MGEVLTGLNANGILSLAGSPYILESLRAGVAGYVTKAKAASHLPEAIDAVCRGEIYVCASGSQRCVEAFLAAAAGRVPAEMSTLASICLEAFLTGPEGLDPFFGEQWEQEALRPATKSAWSSPSSRKQVANWAEVLRESPRDVSLTRSTMSVCSDSSLDPPFAGQRAVQVRVNQYNVHAMNDTIVRKHPVPVSRPTACRLCASLRCHLRQRVIERSWFLRACRFQKRTISSGPSRSISEAPIRR